MRRTKRMQQLKQVGCSADCLLSDSSNDNDELNRSFDGEEVDVDDDRPALVEVMSCNSSFSDCSLPCHELITFSPATQLAKGLVKV